MTNEELIARARTAIGKGCLYGLGKGGGDPEAEHPWQMVKNPASGIVEPRCDCSGFIAWVLGVDRHISHPRYSPYFGNWLETTAVVKDAKSQFGFFTEVPESEARIGDVLVYGDRGKERQGHIGIISEVGPTGPAKAIHCSKGNERRTEDAIQETSAGLWVAAGGIVARYAEAGT